MKPEDPDRELLLLFAEQRSADEASAPDFGELIGRARAQASGRALAPSTREGKWAWRAAAAAAASFALATGLYLLRQEPQPRPLSSVAALVAWKAPTDALLQTPGKDLFGRLPVLLLSVPGGDSQEGAPSAREATPHSTQTKVPHPRPKGVES